MSRSNITNVTPVTTDYIRRKKICLEAKIFLFVVKVTFNVTLD